MRMSHNCSLTYIRLSSELTFSLLYFLFLRCIQTSNFIQSEYTITRTSYDPTSLKHANWTIRLLDSRLSHFQVGLHNSWLFRLIAPIGID
ncbi:hypothetical protein BDR07DRAFT_427869 [Suillus spraguei]|nr:hypothetical protein BDR07DRAFT_427869 [Suillus spraguei]